MVIPAVLLNPVGGLQGLLHEGMLDISVHLVIYLGDLFRLFKFFELIMKLEKTLRTSFIKESLVTLYDSLDVIFHLLELFRSQRRLDFLDKPLLHHHFLVHSLHFEHKPLLLILYIRYCVIHVLDPFELVLRENETILDFTDASNSFFAFNSSFPLVFIQLECNKQGL